MRLASTTLAVALLLSSGLVAAAAPAHAADADVTVTLPSNATLVVSDDVHGHVFVAGASTVLVRDPEGTAVSTIPLTGATTVSRMLLSPDSARLYLLLSQEKAISAIDTSTLTEVARYSTGPGQPLTLAMTGGKLWFGYTASDAYHPDLGVIDPAAATPSATLGLLPSGGLQPLVALSGSPTGPGLLVSKAAGALDFQTIDVSGAGPVLGATRTTSAPYAGQSLTDLRFTPDGTRVLAQTPGGVRAYVTEGLLPDLSYGPSGAFAVSPSGLLALSRGAQGYDQKDLLVFQQDGNPGKSYVTYVPSVSTQAITGLAFSADSSRLYAVVVADSTAYLRVLHEPGRVVNGFTVLTPSHPVVGSPFTLTGTFDTDGTIASGSVLSVVRDHAGQSQELPSVTTDRRRFSVTDTVSVRGDYGYTVSFAGDARHAPTSRRVVVHVLGLAAPVLLINAAGPYAYGAKLTLTGHFFDTTTNRALALYARPQTGGTSTLIKYGTADAQGNVKLAYTLVHNTELTLKFTGDDTHEPVTIVRVLGSQARISTSLTGYYGSSGSYRLFHKATNPGISVSVTPNQQGQCVFVYGQKLVKGTWVDNNGYGCFHLDGNSHTQVYFYGARVVGETYRLLVGVNGNRISTYTEGSWVYWKFTS